MEALGDVAETARSVPLCLRPDGSQPGFCGGNGRDPLTGYLSTNTSCPATLWRMAGNQPVQLPLCIDGWTLRQHWWQGNTVVIKPATDTPWTSRMIAECLLDAGIPLVCLTM